jgi:C1A family cysteine protease
MQSKTRFSPDENRVTRLIPLDRIHPSNYIVECTGDNVSHVEDVVHLKIPMVIVLIILVALSLPLIAADLPSSYDLRNVAGTNYVSSVKSQIDGTCWTHGTMASIEGNLLMTGAWVEAGETSEPNVAEYHLDWWNGFNQHNNDDRIPPEGGGLTVHQGGDYLVAAAYLSRGEGAVRDVDGQSHTPAPPRSDPSWHYFYVRDIEWLTAGADLSNIDAIKEKVMSEGVVATALAYDTWYMVGYIHYQPPDDPADPTHAVAIVGWDDNKATHAPQPGAWLIKNSWGSAWGESGYFWISYYDKHCCQHPEMGAVSFQNVEPMEYDHVYYHDYHGWRDTRTDVDEAFNKFVAVKNHLLRAVSFYTAADNVSYTVRVYDRFEGGLLLDELTSVSGSADIRGYHTVDLDSTLNLSDGDDFYVYLDLSHGGQAFDRTSEVPVLLGARYRTTVESAANPGESYYRSTGDWTDLNYESNTANFCIKALTVAPSVSFECPDGAPSYVPPGYSVPFQVRIITTWNGTIIPGSELLYYSINGAEYSSTPMTVISGNVYEASIPATVCNDRVRFYVCAEELNNGLFYYPDTTEPFMAVSATSLAVAFDDNFQTDLGWTASGDAIAGFWERGVPVGDGSYGDPTSDYDGSGLCYLTENESGNSDIDAGTVILTSPTIDLSGSNAEVTYARWFDNRYGGAPAKDTMEVFISADDGANWTLVETVGPVESCGEGWIEHSFWIGDFVSPSTTTRLRFEASDVGDGSIVEAAVDAVKITSYSCDDYILVVLSDSVHNWTAGCPMTQQLVCVGGTGAVTWADRDSDLAGTGLSLSPEGLLSGTPAVTGLMSFAAEITDELDSTCFKQFSFTVSSQPGIYTSSLPDGEVGLNYRNWIHASGGTAPLVWTDKNSDLEGTGLWLSSAGLLSGLPQVGGTIGFTAVVTDVAGATDEAHFDLYVEGGWICGDINGSGGTTDISDIVFLADYFFGGGEAPPVSDAADVDGSGAIDISDLTYIVSYLFHGGPPPDCR